MRATFGKSGYPFQGWEPEEALSGWAIMYLSPHSDQTQRDPRVGKSTEIWTALLTWVFARPVYIVFVVLLPRNQHTVLHHSTFSISQEVGLQPHRWLSPQYTIRFPLRCLTTLKFLCQVPLSVTKSLLTPSLHQQCKGLTTKDQQSAGTCNLNIASHITF